MDLSTISEALMGLREDVGGLKVGVASANEGIRTLRAEVREDFKKQRDESSDRLKALDGDITGKIDEVSEQSKRRHEDSVRELRAELRSLKERVSRCPQHADPDAPVQLSRRKKSEGTLAARRGVLKSIAIFFGALATVVSGWWSAHSK